MARIRITRIASSAEMRSLLQEYQEKIDLATRRAYEHFVDRGCQHGKDLDDWLEAEQEILGAHCGAVEETQHGYRVRLVLNGFGSQEIQVIAGPDDLVVRAGGSKASSAIQAIRCPATVDVAGIRGSFRGGILTIVAPKLHRHTSGQIPVSE